MKKLSRMGGRIEIPEEQLKKRKKTCYIILLYAVGNTLCVVISISMYCNLIYFLKFIIHKMNSKMVKFEY
jgi:hypothetical protein